MRVSALEKFSFRPTIRLTVVTIFILATMLTAILAVGLQYYFSRQMASEAAITQFNNLSDSTAEFLNHVDGQATQAARLLASYPDLVQNQWANHDARDLFAELMRANNMFYAIYIGFDNGDFYEVINLNASPAVRIQMNATAQDRWVIIHIRGEGEQRSRTYEYYDSNFQLRATRIEASTYDATTRPWFVQAVVGEVNKTAPYLFHSLQAPGQTYSAPIGDSGAVIAVDIALSSMADYFLANDTSRNGEIFLYQKTGEVIASNRVGGLTTAIPPAPAMALSVAEQQLIAKQGILRVSNEVDWPPIDFAIAGAPYGYSIDYLSLIAAMTGIKFEYINGFTWPQLVTRFTNGNIDVLQPVFKVDEADFNGVYSEPFLQLPYALVTGPEHKPISHIRQMQGTTLAIPDGWSIIKTLRKHYPEVQIKTVADSRAVFEAVINSEADAGLDFNEILRYTARRYFYHEMQFHNNIDFSPVDFPDQLHLVIADKNKPLMAVINKAINAVTAEQKAALASKWFNGAAKLQDVGTVPYEELLQLANNTTLHGKLSDYPINGQQQFVFVTPLGRDKLAEEFLAIIVPVDAVLQPALDKVRWSVLATVVFLLLLLPATWMFASPIVSPIKILARENEKIRKRQYRQLHIPESHIKEIHELGVSMQVMAASIRDHEAKQRELMESFIRLIAQAIDDKSSHTAGHCERVPELAVMLARKAEESTTSAFADFAFSGEEERREFRIGAWLHDCGKIITPEHIVDKGVKLETICNRIHEIRTRFELLWRDAEIDYWQQRSLEPEREPDFLAQLKLQRQTLQDDFAFVASMNIGSESLDADKLVRLQKIAGLTWMRNFSNRLGLSPVELGRFNYEESQLPCREQLLADKPEHIIHRHHELVFPEHLAIKMDVPEHLYNLGELYNLSVEYGTLTKEDRFKINEHIISTIRMLDMLPLPEELARVPRYASTHHETMDGQGYPRRLQGDALSVPERIMVLADVFEALTAADRPYKSAKSLSVAVDVLHKMVLKNHVDRDVFELFLSSGVYLQFAKRFLPETQIDAVDIQRYLSPAATH